MISILFLFFLTGCSNETKEIRSNLNAYFTKQTYKHSSVFQETYKKIMPMDKTTLNEILSTASLKIEKIERSDSKTVATIEISQRDNRQVIHNYLIEITRNASQYPSDKEKVTLFRSLYHTTEKQEIHSRLKLTLKKQNNQWIVLPSDKLFNSLLGGMPVEALSYQKEQKMMRKIIKADPVAAHELLSAYTFVSQELYGNSILTIYNHYTNISPAKNISKAIKTYDKNMEKLNQFSQQIHALNPSKYDHFQFMWDKIAQYATILKSEMADQISNLKQGKLFNPNLSNLKWYIDQFHELNDSNHLDATHKHMEE